jgi:hypothetical protein
MYKCCTSKHYCTTDPLLYCASFPSHMGEDSTLPLSANKANQKISQLFVIQFCHYSTYIQYKQ